jgi:hypothetical protein
LAAAGPSAPAGAPQVPLGRCARPPQQRGCHVATSPEDVAGSPIADGRRPPSPGCHVAAGLGRPSPSSTGRAGPSHRHIAVAFGTDRDSRGLCGTTLTDSDPSVARPARSCLNGCVQPRATWLDRGHPESSHHRAGSAPMGEPAPCRTVSHLVNPSIRARGVLHKASGWPRRPRGGGGQRRGKREKRGRQRLALEVGAGVESRQASGAGRIESPGEAPPGKDERFSPTGVYAACPARARRRPPRGRHAA